MDIRDEVRRRIADLTRSAYERGYRDGAQSALAEIENIAADDVVQQLVEVKAPLEAITDKKAKSPRPKKITRRRTSKKTKPGNGEGSNKPKTLIVQEALQSLLTKNGQASRDEVLAAAQAKNVAITKFDLGNGLRTLVKKSKVRVSPDNSSILLPM